MMFGGLPVLEPLGDELFTPDGRPHTAFRVIDPTREAVREAREFTRTTLRRWGLCALCDDVALVASELVTNALRHAVRADGDEHRAADPSDWGTPIRISLARQPSRVVCAVRDPSHAGPLPRCPASSAESGRGLHLVDSFSDTWGWQLLNGTGKIVWALFILPVDKPSNKAQRP